MLDEKHLEVLLEVEVEMLLEPLSYELHRLVILLSALCEVDELECQNGIEKESVSVEESLMRT